MSKKNSLASLSQAAVVHPGVVLSSVGLSLPDNLLAEEWETLVTQLSAANHSIRWALADALNFGQGRYGDKYERAMEATGLEESTLRDYCWVAKSVEMSLRNDNLSFTHHRAVAKLTVAQQAHYLSLASGEGLSVAALRARIEQDQQPASATLEEASQSLSPPIPILPAPLPQDETPEIERVTDEEAGGKVIGGSREKTGIEAGKSQHFNYQAEPPTRALGVPVIRMPTAPPAPVRTSPPPASTKPPAQPTPAPARVTPSPARPEQAVPTDHLLPGVPRVGPCYFYRFAITAAGKDRTVNVMVEQKETGNGMRWQAYTDHGRGDINTIPRSVLFSPATSLKSIEDQLLEHFNVVVGAGGH